MEEMFDIEKFNIISDEENYYFFRALNMSDNRDIEEKITVSEDGKIKRIRTDRERYEGEPKYSEDTTITLEEVYDHIKMHYRKDTNCISLTSNANIAVDYGRGSYKDKYIMVKIPKREFGEKVVNAGQYMLKELYQRIEQALESIPTEKKKEVLALFEEIEKTDNNKDLKEIITPKYTATKGKVEARKAHPRKGIIYSSPKARISSYQSLSEEQALEVNKVYAKLAILENKNVLNHVIPHSSNSNLRMTIGNAFSSTEIINYGEIKQENIIEIPKEIVDVFALIQQVNGIDKNKIEEIKRAVIMAIQEGKVIPHIPEIELQSKENIPIEEMYELTEGKVEYGKANSVVKNMFYLSKARQNAIRLSDALSSILGDNSGFENIIQHIRENGFRVEPEIISRLSGKGVKLSESVNLDLPKEEQELVDEIRKLSTEELEVVLQNGGLANVQDIVSRVYGNGKEDKQIDKSRYYAEAIFSLYDWNKIGIEKFTPQERESLIQKIQESDVVNIYKQLEERGVSRQEIPTVLLNTITGKKQELYEDISIERIERFLGYYDVPNTGIQLRPYQQTAKENADKILKDNRFASLILPTGGGKSFVALAQLMEHQNEEILYLAPQNEILEQMKDYIIKYIHGPVNTLGKSKDELVAEIFPNIKFATYPGLLSKENEELIKKQYGFIVLDELHRTGAKEWGNKLDELIENQTEESKVLGITATPRRDVDGINMANEMAEKLGYTNRDAVNGKHVAMNMSLINAIRMGLVINPKIVSCEYTLQTDGSLDNLKEKIDSIEDVKTRNEELEKYEKLRRSVSDAKGIGQILQENVKQGGKYLVFLPLIENLEDEDGNIIGRKKGKERIAEYEKQIMEYFKDSDIKPSFHSMLGEYGDKENEKRLSEFQSKDTDETEFMLVINKANEGLHLEKLDGIIWLRAMDENSRILYLQQLGRIISAEDPDNPTKEEDRPIAIDIVNNTIKVNWDNEITEKDDIEMMNLITDWIEKHDGMLPDINSNDMEESGYARMLKDIQTKYNKYLNNEPTDLSEEKIAEIQEIIALGTNINLWQAELPDRIQKNKQAGDREQKRNSDELPFEVTGILKDFVELEKEVNEKENTIQKFIEKLRKLQQIGVDVSDIKQKDTIQTLAQRSGITITEEQAEELGIKLDDNIGIKLKNIKQALKPNENAKNKRIPPTAVQVQELEELGINLDVKDRTIDKNQEFIEKLKKLQQIGVDVSKIQKKDTIQKLAQRSGITITEEQAEELGIKLDDNIGIKLKNIKQALKPNENAKNKRIPPTAVQVQELEELGINLDVKDRTIDKNQEFIEKLKKLQQIGVDVSKIQKKDTIQKLAQRSGITITEEQAEELGIKLDDNIGIKLKNIKQALKPNENAKNKRIPPTAVQVQELEELGINLDVKDRTIDKNQEFIEKLKKLQQIGVDVSKIQKKDTIQKLAQRSGITITEEQAEELGIKLDDNIGIKLKNIKQALKPNENAKNKRIPPTAVQVQELEELGINLDVKDRTIDKNQEFIEKLKKLQQIGVDVSKIQKKDTIQKLAQRSGITITEEQAEELGIKLDDNIGIKLKNIKQALKPNENAKNKRIPPTPEQVQELEAMGLNLETKKRKAKEVAEATISAIKDVELADKAYGELQSLAEKTKEGGSVEK